jgi:hypothetical protein
MKHLDDHRYLSQSEEINACEHTVKTAHEVSEKCHQSGCETGN